MRDTGIRAALRAALFLIVIAAAAGAAERAPDVTLRDTVTDAAYRTYRLLPFDVPEGVKAIEVRFDYTGREARTTLDVGLLGPGETFDQVFRGWSGGNKRGFIISKSDATPSYLSGPVTAGKWQLLVGVPNIRKGETSQFTAEVYFQRDGANELPTLSKPLRAEAGWYRGDLHMHSGHSDGWCATKSGQQRGPCPLFLTLDAAANRGLDFVVFTEHNTHSHVRELTALQPYFDRLLLIPGMEMTTFQGHANAFNLREPVDFRVGSATVPDWNTLLKQAASKGAIVSINHPRAPTGEACMGCGWSPDPAVDMSLIAAVEVVNGHDVESPTAGLPFWQEQLQLGHRLTGIGASDTHDVTSKNTQPPPAQIGVPTTVVYARELSAEGIIAGIRAGNAFIDTAGTRDRLLEFTARHGNKQVSMGEGLQLAGRRHVTFEVRVAQVAGGSIEVIRDGAVTRRVPVTATHSLAFEETFDRKRHWVRVNVRDGQGKLALIGNPIYIEATAR